MTDPVPPELRAYLDMGISGPCAVALAEGKGHEGCGKAWCACVCHRH